MTVQRKKQPGPRLDAAEVAAYLAENPGFFEKHTELLETLTVPHPAGGAVSLIERQVSVLRDHNHKLRKQMQELVDIARDNDRLFGRLQHLTLALLEADTLEATFAAVYDQLRQAFGADGVALRFFQGLGEAAERPEFSRDAEEIRARFGNVLASAKPVCGRFAADQLRVLFGEQASDLKSAALVPLGHGGHRTGLLAVASLEAGRFRAGMSTLFLKYLGETVSVAVERYLR